MSSSEFANGIWSFDEQNSLAVFGSYFSEPKYF